MPTLAILVASSFSMACAKPQLMTPSTSVPASTGTVKATKGDNGNTNVSIRVSHLARPSKVEADSTVYVVWIQARGGDNQSAGALAVNEDLEGSLDVVTPHQSFKLTVTPEPNAAVALPTHDPVFTADVERK